MSRSDLQWAYHVTLREFLPGIAQKGLLPRWHRSADEPVIFVEDDQEQAEIYATPETATLRFLVDGFGTTEDGEYVLYDRIAPSEIFVSGAGGWRPLIGKCP